MNKKYINTIVATLLLFGISSCSDYLNQVPADLLTMEKIFETRESTQTYLSSIYTYMPDEFEQRWTAAGYKSQGTSGVWVAGCDEGEYV